MLHIVSANLNGIRSAANKGFFDWLQSEQPDCVGVQELKAQDEQLSAALRQPAGLQGYFHCAEKKGYSGVGLYTRQTPDTVIYGLNNAEFDAEGRWIEARFDRGDRRLSIISCYFPSGSSSDERQQAKFRFLDLIYPHLLQLRAQREFILVGDINIAHREIDRKNWKGNVKNSGFLPEERAWMSRLLGEAGLVDVYRQLYPQAGEEAYTWWSNRGQAWAKNVGWRIDYQLATPALAALARSASVYKAQRFSDHAPLSVHYELDLG